MASANSKATTITAKIKTAPVNKRILVSDKDGTPIIDAADKNVIANKRPPICNATPALVMVATASHFPANSCILLQGRHRSASRVPLSLSPAVISIDGCIALEAVHIAITIGMNNDKARPACSPLVAASAASILPSHVTGSNVVSGSRPASTNVPLITPLSQDCNDNNILPLASLEASLVEKCKTENRHDSFS